MSDVVDSRVLEMRFDNAQFEKGVATSMSTLEKLKQKLNLSGASKGLENLSDVAKKIDLSGVGTGVETLQAKFSALQVVGVTALANITNAAVNTGRRIVSAITIDPIKNGMAEYETQMNAVQTILANTQKEGTNVERVNKALDELNTYADKTIYNFTEMTRNIGTFTAAGVDLDTSVNAIQGIANLAAVSGSTSQQASVAMYQLSQALAAGTIKLMDWNSVVNAGMGGQVFQDALTKTSEELQTGAKAAIEAKGSFRESLSEGWLTAQVLTETLKKFTTSGATEYVAEYTGLSKDAVEATLEETDAWGKNADAIDKAAQALAEKSGKNADEIKDALQFAKTAEDAATKVKTFSQLIDTLKEALGSGWTTTWRLIIGDFEEAKELWTNVSDFFSDIINKSADVRNTIVEAVMKGPFGQLATRINDVTKATEAMTAATSKFQDIADEVIRGNFGNGQDRVERLTQAGYDWAYVQNIVNEKLGDSTRHATDFTEAQDGLTEAQAESVQQLMEMSDAQLKEIGFTELEIQAFRDLAEQSKKTGIPLNELLQDVDKLSGRNLLIDSFKNAANGLIDVFGAIKQAWHDIFWGDATEDDIIATKTMKLYDAISALHKFSTYLSLNKETADKLTRTFKGLFAIIQLVTDIFGGGFKLGLKIISRLLSEFGLDILDVTAGVGDAIVQFRNFIDNNELVNKSFELLAKGLKKAFEFVVKLIDAFKQLPQVQKAISKIKDGFKDLEHINLSDLLKDLYDLGKDTRLFKIGSAIVDKFKNVLSELEGFAGPKAKEVGKYIIDGLVNGIGDRTGSIASKMMEIGNKILDAICEVLDIHSPSRKMYEIGKNVVDGLYNGIKDGGSKLFGLMKEFGSKIADFAKNMPYDKLFAGGIVLALVLAAKQIADAIGGIASAFDGFGSVCEGAENALNGLGKMFKGIGTDFKAKAFQKMAISIAILVAALLLLTQVDDMGKLWNAVAVIAALSAILVALSVAMDHMTAASAKIDKGGVSIEGLKNGLVQIGIALLLLAAVVKIVGSMNPEEAKQGFIGLTALAVEMGAFFAVMASSAEIAGPDADEFGKCMKKLAVAMLLMAIVCKLVGTLSEEEMIKGAAFASAFVIFAGLLSVGARIAGPNADSFGKMAKKMAVAMALMVIVCKLVGTLSEGEMIKGASFAVAFAAFVGLLGLAVRAGGKEMPKLGRFLLAISASMVLLVGVCKLVGLLSESEMKRGAAFAAAFVIFVGALTKVTTVAGDKQVAKVGTTILAIAAAIGILAAVCIALSFIDIKGLANGLIVVGLLSLFMAGLITACKGVEDIKGTLIAMTVAIGVMAASVVALSFIKPEKLAGATAALGILMGVFALMLKSTPMINGSMTTILAMVAVVGALAGILFMMSSLYVGNTVEIAASLSMLMLSLAGAVKIISGVGKDATAAIPAMLAMSAVMAIVGVILAGLAVLKVGSTLEIATSLGMLMFSLAASVRIIGGVGKEATTAIPAAFAMSAVLAIVAAILAGLAVLNLGPTLEIAESLSILMLSLSTACLIIAGAATVASLASAGIAPLMAVMVAMGALMAVIAGLVTWQPDLEEFVGKSLPILKLLGQGIGEFVGGIITGVGNAVLDLLPALGNALSEFMSCAQPFIDACKGVDESVITGAGYLTGAILALTAANFISGVTQLLGLQTFSMLGTRLSNFMDGAKPFLDGLKNVDSSDVEAAKAMAEVILALTASNLLSGITSFTSKFTGGTNMESFGDMLTSFGEAMVTFSDTVKGKIDSDSITAAANAGETMARLANSIQRTGGYLQKLTGTADLEGFGDMCKAFGKAIKEMSDSLTGENGTISINNEAIDTAVTAGEAMSRVADSIQRTGGYLQKLTGTADLSNFGEMCKSFGEAIKEMSNSLSGENGGTVINQEAIDSAATAGQAMNQVADAIQSTGGILQKITGVSDLGEFGSKCKSFGEALREMSKALTGEDGGSVVDQSVVDSAVTAGKAMAALEEAIPEKNLFDGKVSLSEFGEKIKSFGGGLKDYSDSVSGADGGLIDNSISWANKLVELAKKIIDMDASGFENFASIYNIGDSIKKYSDHINGINTEAVSVSVKAAIDLKNLVNNLKGFDPSPIYSFNIDSLGTKIKDYSDSLSGFNSSAVSLSVNAIKMLINVVNDMSSLNTSGVSSFTQAISDLSGVQISAVVKAFNGATTNLVNLGVQLVGAIGRGMTSKQNELPSKATTIINDALSKSKAKSSEFYLTGSNLMKKFASGMRSQSSNISSASTSALSSATSNMRSYYSSFYRAGSYVASGFSSGIRANIQSAASAAARMASAASNAARQNLKIHSPSRVFKEIGSYVPQGFAQGISMFGGQVKKSVSTMADTATSTTQSVLAQMLSMIDSNIDAQPTISPVVDLSNARSGISALNGMLSTGQTIGIRASLNDINTSMNYKNQNGDIGEVVSAINKLRKDIGNMEHATYQINGITYDDGSNISDAISTIVKAARIGRRV